MFFSVNSRLTTLAGLLVINTTAQAETALVAVAANFTKPMNEIAQVFEKTSRHTAKLSFGSSGKFVAQFENGAPFEVFLSADDKSPLKLEESGLAVSGSRFTYAVGKLVLWAATVDFVDSQGQVLSSGNFKHIALADPKLAPYGAAAIDTLTNLGLLDKLQPTFVHGENIAQTYQFVSSGNAELGFVALSQVMENGKIGSGSGWTVPTNLYKPILQDAILLNNGRDNPAAKALLEFLKTAPARAIIEKYGYSLPQ
ncbi:molybdate ABC transporter substrate-binding protein [Methylomonas sp. HW2-6]|uniref:molybdate ABC transporter substrate-binding protein n=1 Tax=Methylomonas sp. HW2-6 TaxID=3376687 RepID=UPI0040411CE2